MLKRSYASLDGWVRRPYLQDGGRWSMKLQPLRQWTRVLANNAKIRTRDMIFTWKTLAGKNHGRQSAIFTMMRELQRRKYNEPSRSSREACKMYIWWTKLTAVKYGNKSAKHITRTVGPPGIPARLTLRIRIISNKLHLEMNSILQRMKYHQ
jgi:hypothetical protein